MHTLISLMKALLLNVKRLRRLQRRFDVERMRWEDRSSLCCRIKANPLNSPLDLAVIKGQTWHKERCFMFPNSSYILLLLYIKKKNYWNPFKGIIHSKIKFAPLHSGLFVFSTLQRHKFHLMLLRRPRSLHCLEMAKSCNKMLEIFFFFLILQFALPHTTEEVSRQGLFLLMELFLPYFYASVNVWSVLVDRFENVIKFFTLQRELWKILTSQSWAWPSCSLASLLRPCSTGSATGTVPAAVLSYSDYISRPEDYSSILRFDRGEREKLCRVMVIDDSLYEGEETFNVSLAMPVGGRLGMHYHTTKVNILEDADDGKPGERRSSSCSATQRLMAVVSMIELQHKISRKSLYLRILNILFCTYTSFNVHDK